MYAPSTIMERMEQMLIAWIKHHNQQNVPAIQFKERHVTFMIIWRQRKVGSPGQSLFSSVPPGIVWGRALNYCMTSCHILSNSLFTNCSVIWQCNNQWYWKQHSVNHKQINRLNKYFSIMSNNKTKSLCGVFYHVMAVAIVNQDLHQGVGNQWQLMKFILFQVCFYVNRDFKPCPMFVELLYKVKLLR